MDKWALLWCSNILEVVLVEVISGIIRFGFETIGALVVGGVWWMVITMIRGNNPKKTWDTGILWSIVTLAALFLSGFYPAIVIGWVIGTLLAFLVGFAQLGGYTVAQD